MTVGRTAVMAFALLFGSIAACAPRGDTPTTVAGTQRNDVLPAGRELALPVVSGRVGPFAHATVTLTRPAGEATAPFTGMVDVGDGPQIALAGPDEPADFFLFEARTVVLAPIDPGAATNGIVILYYASRIGPGHGTERRALVYRVTTDAATRVPALEALLEGAVDAATVRRRLAKAGAGR